MTEAEERRHLRREVLWAAGGILLLLGVVKHLGAVIGSEIAFTVAIGAQLYVPLMRVGRSGVTLDTLGLRVDRLGADLRDFAVAAVVTGVPYAGLFYLWQTEAQGRSFHFTWPDGFWERALVELCVIALAEELFFRGYLQERLSRLLPARRRIFGAPFGWALIATSAVFAVAHFVGEYRLARLAPFFPSLVFGLLFARRGSLIAPVTYHAFCNLLADVLFASHR